MLTFSAPGSHYRQPARTLPPPSLFSLIPLFYLLLTGRAKNAMKCLLLPPFFEAGIVV
jgi:hypothetical protein